MRTAFVNTLIELAAQDERIFLVNGDLGFNVLEPFVEKFAGRHLNLGVAEQNLIGFAAGLALSGKLPIVYSIATFATLKTIEQVRNDVCYQGLNVKIVGVGSGLTYSLFGATHHSVEDIALMRVLPGMKVVCPGDPVEAEKATRAIMADEGPVYLRLASRGEPVIHPKDMIFTLGKGIVIREGKDIALIATGNMLENTVEAGKILIEQGLDPMIVSMHTVKPLDEELLRRVFQNFSHVYTVEEHSRIGGLGSAVAELVSDWKHPRAVLHKLALPDQFQKLGYWLATMREKNNLSPEGIASTVRKTYNI